MPEIKISFYSYECNKNQKIVDCLNYINNDININYPYIVLIKYNNWNDYSYKTLFETFYVYGKELIKQIGEVKIIESKAIDKSTKLPSTFETLNKKKYFSRGDIPFYNSLKTLGEYRDIILESLNDIHHYNYTYEKIIKIDNELAFPYLSSLFRHDFYNLDVYSDYSKNARNMLT